MNVKWSVCICQG